MRRFAFAAALFAVACTAAAQQPAAKKKTDLELIQGTWWIVGLESAGKKQSEKGIGGNTITFAKVRSADTATLQEGPYPKVEFTYSLDETSSPKAIELSAKGTRALGIYKLEGDDLTICVSLGGPRPTEFATKVGGDTELFVLKRNRWERFSGKGLGFSVEFPGRPTEARRETDGPGGKVTTTVFSVRSEMERTTYAVAVTALPERPDAKETQAVLDAAQKALLAELDAATEPRVDAEAAVGKPPPGVSAAREFTASMRVPQSRDRGVMRVRLYVAGERVYALAVTGPDDVTRSPNVARFWNSFRTPEGKKGFGKQR
jgi:uncharacterized protein (TIGR03067 family)